MPSSTGKRIKRRSPSSSRSRSQSRSKSSESRGKRRHRSKTRRRSRTRERSDSKQRRLKAALAAKALKKGSRTAVKVPEGDKKTAPVNGSNGEEKEPVLSSAGDVPATSAEVPEVVFAPMPLTPLKSPPATPAQSHPSPSPTVSSGARTAPAALLGDLAQLRQKLEQDKDRLQLFVLQAKREMDERRETQDRQERREREYFQATFGEPVGPGHRLFLEAELGKGAFSTVFRARDMATEGKEYAVKFIRLNSMLRRATEREVKLMRRLRLQASERDPEGASCLLGLTGPETFEHEGHLALVFHLQKCDLRSGLRRYAIGGAGLPLPMVRNYARNIFMALRALRKVNVIHTDLKPDNLLISLDKASVKLSDFGSAMEVSDQQKVDYLQPRYYRAPEVILGQRYSTQIDMWSAGCTIFELVTGRYLFTGRTNNEMILSMLKDLGAFPRTFASAGDFSGRYFGSDGAFRLGAEGDAPGQVELLPRAHFPRPATPLLKRVEEGVTTTSNGPGGDPAHIKAHAKLVTDLIVRCMTPDPSARATPEKALVTNFLKSLPSDS